MSVVNKELNLSSLDQTKLLAEELANELTPPQTIILSGSLGAGKTTFTRLLVNALGSKDSTSSPTFVLEQIYRTASGLIIEHWDLYRLNALPEELSEPPDKNTIRIVEWGEKFDELVNSAQLQIFFTIVDLNERTAIIRNLS